jgi:cellulose synthase/poly-beta-1,6-N-acetylglucosamine synthase-like glycosyltransferase
LGLTWVAYPVVVAALATVSRRRAVPAAGVLPTVSVVVASRESAADILQRVADIQSNGYPNDLLQIVIALDVQGGAPPAEAFGQLPGNWVVVESGRGAGKAMALNEGVAASVGDVLIFTDTFQQFQPHAVERLARAAKPTAVGAVSGRLVLPRENRAENLPILAYWKYETWLRRNEAKLFSGIGVFGPIWAMRRERWQPLPTGLILDDLYSPMRLVLEGFRTEFCNDAVALDLRPQQPAREFRRKVRTLTGNLQLVAWLPDTIVPGRNPIWFQYVFHKLMRLATPYFLLLSLGVLVPFVGSLLSDPPQRSAVAILASLTLLSLLLSVRLRRFARTLVVWLASMQAAMVTATYYGLRGEWDVWRR